MNVQVRCHDVWEVATMLKASKLHATYLFVRVFALFARRNQLQWYFKPQNTLENHIVSGFDVDKLFEMCFTRNKRDNTKLGSDK